MTRLATVADLDALLTLDRQCFGGGAWSQDSWSAELAKERVRVLDVGDSPVAVAVTMSVGPDVELLRIAVDPRHRRSGHARKLLDLLLDGAAAAGSERMMLEVEVDNLPALGLYESCGFLRSGLRSDYYGPGRHGVLMDCLLADKGLA